MKKGLLYVGIAIVGLVCIIALAISPIAKSVLENHSKEYIGRKVSMDKLSLNIFSGRLKVSNFTMYEADDSASFVTLKLFDVNVNLKKLLTKTFEIESILLSDASVQIIQNQDNFNFTDILNFFSDTTAAETDTTSSEWGVIVNNIQLAHSSIYYQDKSIGGEWNLKDISVVIPGIDLSYLKANMGMQLKFLDGGKLATNVKYDTEKSLYDLHVDIQNFQLTPILPYLQQSLNVDSLAGTFSTNLYIKGSTEHLMNFDANGFVKIGKACLRDMQEKDVFAADSIFAEISHIDMINNKIELKSILVSGLSSYYEIFNKNTDNLTKLIKPTPASSQVADTAAIAQSADTTSKPLDVRINTLRIANSSFNYIDHTLPKAFNYNISNITVSVNNFNLNQNNDVELSALLQNTGKLKIKWIGNINDISNQNISVTLNNLDLKPFSSYSLAMFGNPITSGHISIQSQNIITNNMLNGANKINIYDPKFGDKNRDIKPEYSNIPLKMGIYVLTDKDNKANFDIPISGNINSPSFSYGKLIIKTLGNLLVKVAASPFAMIQNDSTIEQITFSVLETEFADEEYAQFAKLSTLQKEKPQLKVYLTQNVEYEPTLAEYCVIALKKDMAINDSTSNVTVANADDILIKEQYRAIPTKSVELTAFANKMMQQKGLANNDKLTNEERATMLYGEAMRSTILKDMNTRNALLHYYLTKQCTMPDTVLSITSNLIESDSVKISKNNYKVSWKIDE